VASAQPAQPAQVVPAGREAYIGAAYWFTSSTAFADPAVTAGRMFSDTFAGIAPEKSSSRTSTASARP
jgi:hypothetical protein